MVFAPPQHGKLLAHDTPVLTTKGWSTHGELYIGDSVYNQFGEPVKVIALSEDGFADVEVEFNDGSVITCHENHEWVLKKHKHHYRRVETKELIGTPLFTGTKGKRGSRAIYQVWDNYCIEGTHKDLPIDPYTLGAWLGDGSTTKNCITYHPKDAETIEAIGTVYGNPTGLCTHPETGIKTAYFKPLYKVLKENDLFGNKHIPDEYFTASVSQRLELLAGLIDTDGYTYQANGRVTFSNINTTLINDVKKLCATLGFRATICEFEARVSTSGIIGRNPVYQLCFNPDIAIPCKIPRKATIKTNPQKRLRSIREVSRVSPKAGRCIQVEGGIYLVGERMVATHNSEIVTRRTPAFALGQDPNKRIIVSAYNASLAQSFNRDIQRIIDDEPYRELFPDTLLNASNVKSSAKGSYLRNSDVFQVVNHDGYLRSVGVMGPLTSFSCDLGIIDDPIKDAMEANSQVFRDRLWDWFVNVFETRLHNDSRVLITLTRWHYDDLCGRLLARDGSWDEGGDWKVIKYEAIKESEEGDGGEDFRNIGDALWPEKHSLERLAKVKKSSPRTFISLYQQRPAPESGNIIKREWFNYYDAADLPEQISKNTVWDLAYTSKEENDPSGGLAYAKYKNNYYIIDRVNERKELPDLLPLIERFANRNDAEMNYIENKASGVSAIQMLKRKTALNVREYKVPAKDKKARLMAQIDYLEGGRIFLPKNKPWVDAFLDSLCAFPFAPHDEDVDLLTMLLAIEGKKEQSTGTILGTW